MDWCEEHPPEHWCGKKQLPSAPPSWEEMEAAQKGCPLAPVVTTVTQFENIGQPPRVKQESKALTPEQARAIGKHMSPCNQDTVLNWLAKLSVTLHLTQDDVTCILRECMSNDDFAALPYNV